MVIKKNERIDLSNPLWDIEFSKLSDREKVLLIKKYHLSVEELEIKSYRPKSTKTDEDLKTTEYDY